MIPKLILIIWAMANITLFLVAGCSQRDIPQAEIGTFEVISADTIPQYTNSRYVTTWYDIAHKVTYTVYTNYPSGFRKGQTIPGLIRK